MVRMVCSGHSQNGLTQIDGHATNYRVIGDAFGVLSVGRDQNNLDVRDAAIRVFRPEFLGDPDRDTPYRVSIDGKIVADLWSGHSGERGIPGRAST